MPTTILRLILLLLTPLWLSLGAEMLGLRLSLPDLLSDWARKDKADPTLVPPLGWRESAYLAANPDVAAAVRDGLLPSGYDHYTRFGRAEGRPGVPVTPPTPAPMTPAPVVPAPMASAPVASAPVASATEKPPEPEPAAPVIPDTAPHPAPPAIASAPKPAPKPATADGPLLVSRMRTAVNADMIRIVLDLDGPARFEPPVRRKADRLEIGLPGTLWKTNTIGSIPATPLTYRAETSGTSSRLIVSGEAPIEIKALFTLPPDQQRGHRLVIDVAVPAPRKRT